MTKLSDTQSIVLSAAAQRPDGNVLPLSGSLRGAAAGKVVTALLGGGLIREQIVDSPRKADPALNTVWRNLEDGRGVLLFITAAGLDALGIELNRANTVETEDSGTATQPAGAPTGADEAAAGAVGTDNAGEQERLSAAPTGARVRKTREGTKQAALVEMLKRPEGATITEVVEATGWQPHTVRGAFAGALKKKLGLTIASEKVDGRGRVYRLC